MVSVDSQQPYTSLKSAWRYRKEFVQGCSCKAAEYQPQVPGKDKKAEAPHADHRWLDGPPRPALGL